MEWIQGLDLKTIPSPCFFWEWHVILYVFFGGVGVNFDAYCIFVAVEIVGACSVGSHKFCNVGASIQKPYKIKYVLYGMDDIFLTCQKLVFLLWNNKVWSCFCGASRLKLFVYIKVAWKPYRLTKLRQFQKHAALWLTCLCMLQKYMHIFVQALGLHMYPQDQKNQHLHHWLYWKQTMGKPLFWSTQCLHMFTWTWQHTCSLSSRSLMAWLCHAVWIAKA